jgi:hypothetical protein
MVGLGAPWGGHGELAGEGRGRGRGERRGRHGLRAAWGEGGLHEGRRACSLAATAARFFYVRCVLNVLSVVREKEEARKREEKKRKERKRGKNMENFANLKFFGEKSKRQFMKLVKKIFLYKKGINLIIIK